MWKGVERKTKAPLCPCVPFRRSDSRTIDSFLNFLQRGLADLKPQGNGGQSGSFILRPDRKKCDMKVFTGGKKVATD